MDQQIDNEKLQKYKEFVETVNARGISVLECFDFGKLGTNQRILGCLKCSKRFGIISKEEDAYRHYIDKHIKNK